MRWKRRLIAGAFDWTASPADAGKGGSRKAVQRQDTASRRRRTVKCAWVPFARTTDERSSTSSGALHGRGAAAAYLLREVPMMRLPPKQGQMQPCSVLLPAFTALALLGPHSSRPRGSIESSPGASAPKYCTQIRHRAFSEPPCLISLLKYATQRLWSQRIC